MWKRFTQWLAHRHKHRQWCEFREWYQVHIQAQQFTMMKCRWCFTAAPNPDAHFCYVCGSSLHTDQGYTTDPIHVVVGGERPFHAYRRELQQQQQDITNYPTQKFPPRRPLRTARLEGKEHFG